MDVVEWCRLHDIWYLKIDLEIPDVCISEAQAVYDEGFSLCHIVMEMEMDGSQHHFMDLYPTLLKIRVWDGTTQKIPLVMASQKKTVKWGWTEIAEITPETKRWLEDFPHKTYRRCRFMLLRPNGRIEAHHDQDSNPGRRTIAAAINLAFYQPDNCYLRRADTKEELPFQNCTGFWFDNGVVHEAHNASNENRFHFIIHGGSNNRTQRTDETKPC